MTQLPVTLSSAAACALLNIWLGSRISRLRGQFKVSVGDGGNDLLLRRMRAQANFIENAPFVLILLAGIELWGGNRLALQAIAAIFIMARIAHPIGMDGPQFRRWRMVGMMGSALVTVALAGWAIALIAGY
ncbi:hypothetical protein GCM10022276_21170 [Sphingomonas limnosediminicola]|jgi:uncharacterized membrane protein YecN with MAPEG domain|uniref:MAPEG family protein n=1 Tax=Sphingomonas limnosediminicola TaxID=940133 RepID=A0ABP7LHW8_9SPHN